MSETQPSLLPEAAPGATESGVADSAASESGAPGAPGSGVDTSGAGESGADNSGSAAAPGSAGAAGGYRVLARKYRPACFEDLIGQQAMVQTLANAFASGRIAHAFMLTGMRGVGKTTTARIIARALNYTDAAGRARPGVEMKERGVHCADILAARHVDVLEMDAASRTGIADIREIIDNANYRPALAPVKVYIIDEVHMLSTAAFNGLLKTLEEPPEHVVFIFATTEVRKVPVTVLSRCQRFDLRRLTHEEILTLLRRVARQEGIAAQDEALALMARAAEGAARDALSLLDQAIAHGAGKVEAGRVREMLGLAGRVESLELFDRLMAGRVGPALELLRAHYDRGGDPAAALSDLADLTHWLTRRKLAPDALEDYDIPPEARARAAQMAEALSVRVLTLVWQMLLKGLQETQSAHHGLRAAEMVLIRIAHAADLPAPEEVIRRLEQSGGGGDFVEAVMEKFPGAEIVGVRPRREQQPS